jgi:acyl carrier protein
VTRDAIADDVRAMVLARSTPADLSDHLPLGADGVGLDSIALVELLLECETRFGVSASELLGEPLSIGRLIEHLEQAHS